MVQNKKIAEDTSLVVTTYNKPLFLEIVLKCILLQKMYPCEVIIADDGSTDKTRELIDRYREIFPVPLVHSWIPDEGFRVAMSRNVAIAKAKGDYIIIIDGDIMLSPLFVKDHIKYRKRGFFLTGDRSYLKEEATQRRCISLNPSFSFFTRGLNCRCRTLHISWLHNLYKGYKGRDGRRKLISCNMSFWKSDIVAVNGFDERMTGWGCEDTELGLRFYNKGLKRRHLRGIASCVHLYHRPVQGKEDSFNKNLLLEEETLKSGNTWATKGIDQYL
jgi:glycosyltransferase involved in cell wall biosynthesis